MLTKNTIEKLHDQAEKSKTKLDLERLLFILDTLKVTPEEFFKGVK
jgi:hypothetical protein